jgi:lysophospholipase L1-like esterase
MRRMRRLSILVVVLLSLVGFAPAAQAGTAMPTGLPRSMAAAGDSITRGYDALLFGCFLADCPQYAWSTGTSSSVNSHYARVRAASPGVSVTTANVARTGAKMADLDRQLTLIGTGVQYVTVLLGANDVCTSSAATMTDPALFRKQFADAMGTFFGTHPDAYVFVSSIPNVRQLYELLKGNRTATSTWRNFGICQSMLASTNTTAQRDAVSAREAEFNKALAEVCASVARCRWDGGAVFGYAFRTTDVSSVDYFHPSVTGQKTLAALSWKVGYWGP